MIVTEWNRIIGKHYKTFGSGCLVCEMSGKEKGMLGCLPLFVVLHIL